MTLLYNVVPNRPHMVMFVTAHAVTLQRYTFFTENKQNVLKN